MGHLKYRRNLHFSPGKAFHSWYLLASFTPVCSFQSCVPTPFLLPPTQASVPQTIPPEPSSPCKFIFIDNASQSSPSPRAAPQPQVHHLHPGGNSHHPIWKHSHSLPNYGSLPEQFSCEAMLRSYLDHTSGHHSYLPSFLIPAHLGNPRSVCGFHGLIFWLSDWSYWWKQTETHSR